MENKKWSLVGAFLAAIAASACCLGPLILAALGLGSLGAFSGFEKYRPIFVTATLILLAVAFYRVYWQHEEKCENGSCRVSSSGPKVLLWITAVAAIGILSSPRWLPAQMKGKANPVSVKDKNLETVFLKVTGMDCAMCIPPIERNLRKVPGISFAHVDFKKQTAVVRGIKLDVKKLIAGVKAAGYKAAQIKNPGEKP